MTGDPLAGLKGFQRDTAAHVYRMLFEKGRTRFLVADEVGLGKTLVARGVVAKAIRRLEADGVRRIDVVYISSNAEIGRQNVRRLIPEGYEVFDRLNRLTLLPLHVRNLDADGRPNFIAFTPGTMPDGGWRTGWAEERALIFVLLAHAWGFRSGRGPIRLLMRPARKEKAFRDRVNEIRRQKPYGPIGDQFVKLVETDERGLRGEFDALSRIFARGRPLTATESERQFRLVAKLRLLLARACVKALEPDLVILDEFQRFRHLFDEESEAAMLFRAICEYADEDANERARVLLLSATPYRMYTTADEVDDHYSDFVRTLRFLMHDDPEAVDRAGALLEDYRTQLLTGDEPDAILAARDQLSVLLRTVMVRTERLAASADRCEMLDPVPRRSAELRAIDVANFITLDRALGDVGAQSDGAALQYWLSAPYLANLMDDYKLKRRLRDAAATRSGSAALARRWKGNRGLLPFNDVRAYRQVDPANAKLRTLIDETVAGGNWRLLWLPPTLPYYIGGPHFERAAASTKRLVFSSWRVAPRAIAALTSYEAERLQITTGDKERLDRRLLDFNVARKTGRRAGMPALSLMYPCLALAAIDPLELCRERACAGEPRATLAEARAWARTRVAGLLEGLPAPTEGPEDKRWYWAAPILLDGSAALDLLSAPGVGALWAGGDEAGRWLEHVELARQVAAELLDPPLGRRPDDLVDVLGEVALGAPGVACLRSLGRVLGGRKMWQSIQIRAHAASAAWGVRVLLNHPESISLIRATVRRGEYWRRALTYCVEGGVQSVLDEFAHLTFDLRALGRLEDVERRSEDLARMIRLVTAARSIQLAPDEVVVSPRKVAFARCTMRTRFAMRYGEVEDESSGERTSAEAARDAFNSPFAPFVLATTSVGQEGLDFHAYCHAVVHWNLPSNPVDLEQREGRVHRYKGHAVRKNVVAAVGERALRRSDPDPWSALFAEAEASESGEQNSDIVPYWVFPGEARIERRVPALPLSREEERLEQLQRALALYRAVLGQPRQEELVGLLARRELPEPLTYEDMRIDLTPPPRSRRKARAPQAKVEG
jgi:hypothetical protein